ncbi:MAG: PaaI family thioesterase [Polyangiaceae bacterium]|nr:PaaI family thioesterase [Polyangiaceae bacterium]
MCGRSNPLGLRAVYVNEDDGSVFARVRCEAVWAGYPGSLHGGITTSLLDGAMVHCLFARGIAAVTARIAVEFHGPVSLLEELSVTAHVLSGRHGVYELEAELAQLDRVRATAAGTFVQMSGCDLGPNRWRPGRADY